MSSKKNVLITGGTGLVGARLSEILIENGYEVSYLSRTKGSDGIKQYVWSIPKGYVDEEAIKNADYIVNLAGANLIDKRWTESFKKVIIDSRVQTIGFLEEKLKTVPNKVQAFISASAIGYYGPDTGNKVLHENDEAGEGFLVTVVKKWEEAADQIQKLNIRTVKIRIGIVLSDKGGALVSIVRPIRMFVGSPVASGNQYISWIHIDDLCGMILKSIQDNSMSGVYNGVAPEPATNSEFTKKAAKVINRPIIAPNVPGFVLKLILGAEKAKMVIGGNKVSSDKIQSAGYKFKFPKLSDAMDDLLK